MKFCIDQPQRRNFYERTSAHTKHRRGHRAWPHWNGLYHDTVFKGQKRRRVVCRGVCPARLYARQVSALSAPCGWILCEHAFARPRKMQVVVLERWFCAAFTVRCGMYGVRAFPEGMRRMPQDRGKGVLVAVYGYADMPNLFLLRAGEEDERLRLLRQSALFALCKRPDRFRRAECRKLQQNAVQFKAQ